MAASVGSANISICGPDGTKVGTDLNVVFGAIMYQRAKKVAVLPIQVICDSRGPLRKIQIHMPFVFFFDVNKSRGCPDMFLNVGRI